MPKSPSTSFDPNSAETTLFAALLTAGRRHGMKRDILEDVERKPLNYKMLVLGALIMGSKLAEMTRPLL